MRRSRSEKGIGIFDSGGGGITVMKEVMQQLPQEKLYYFADTKHLPYGPRRKEEVRVFAEEIISFLLHHPIKAIVIACNTATASVSLPYLRERFDIPIIGVIEPGARAAIKASLNGRVGVIGTQGTIASGAYEQALKQINPQLEVYNLACPDFVPIVEKGLRHTKLAKETVRLSLEPIQQVGLDALILGCTHYPLLADPISKVLGDHVTLVNSAEETVSELRAVLQREQLLSVTGQSEQRFFCSGEAEILSVIAKEWLDQTITVEKVNIQSVEETISQKSS